jgi:hypothetical protein
MGMETLNSAARAAGFAMAASDEPYQQAETGKTENAEWRPGEAVLRTVPVRQQPHHRTGDWLKGLLGLFGRRIPASPA